MAKRNYEDEKEVAALKDCLARIDIEIRGGRETTGSLLMFCAATAVVTAILTTIKHDLAYILIGGFVTAFLGASAIGSYRNTRKFAQLIPQIKADLLAYGETRFGFPEWNDVDNPFDNLPARFKRWLLWEVVGIVPVVPQSPLPSRPELVN